jgi:hypothetical protein
MNPRTACVVLFAVSALAGSAAAQGRPPPQSFNAAEAYAEIEVLKQQVAALQQQAAQEKAQFEQELTAARFRITVLEADMKQGGATTQLQASITALTARTSTLEAHWSQTSPAIANLELRLNALNTQFGALNDKFQVHTHTYRLTTFGFANEKLLPPIHVGEEGLPTKTSPPN